MLEKPIYYRGYKLQYKTPEEWEAFGQLNPHIPPKFWDSPIIQNEKLGTRTRDYIKKRQSLQKIGAHETGSRTFNAERHTSPYQVPAENSRPFGQTEEEYAAALTEKRRQERLARVLQAQKEARLAKEAGAATVQPSFPSYSPTVGPKQGPVQSGPAKLANNPIITVGRHFPSSIALFIVITWYPIQFLFFMMSLGLFSSGMLAMVAAAPIAKVAEWLGYNLSGLLGVFLAGGIGVAVLNAALSLMVLGIVLLLYRLSGTNALGGAENTVAHKHLLFGAALLGYIFLPIAPWAIPWINYVKINPE